MSVKDNGIEIEVEVPEDAPERRCVVIGWFCQRTDREDVESEWTREVFAMNYWIINMAAMSVRNHLEQNGIRVHNSLAETMANEYERSGEVWAEIIVDCEDAATAAEVAYDAVDKWTAEFDPRPWFDDPSLVDRFIDAWNGVA